MSNVTDVVSMLAKIKRERDLVKSSAITDAAKAKLLVQLDALEAKLSAEVEAEAPAGGGAVTGATAPGGAAARGGE